MGLELQIGRAKRHRTMEESEKVIPWLANPDRRKPIPKLLPDDWVNEYQVKVQNRSGSERGLNVVFEEVLTVRVAEDGLCEKLAALCTDSVWRTFKVEGSQWLKAFHKETYGTYADHQIEHFIFVSDVVVEVLAAGEPRVEELTLPASFKSKW